MASGDRDDRPSDTGNRNIMRLGVEALNGILTALTNSFLFGSSTLTVGVSTVSGLPDANEAGQGARRTVTDASATTFASVVAGGGANIVPVYSDGSAWRIG
jgi:hypothetical protein